MALLGNKIASVEISAAQDCSKGNKIPLNQLLSSFDFGKEFDLLDNVESNKTKIRVTVDKADSFQTRPDSTRKKGEKSSLLVFLQRNDFARKVNVTGDIRKGDKLLVKLETY